MTEIEAITAGGTLHSRSNPHLCAIYAKKFSRAEAVGHLRHWQQAKREAATRDWREDCQGHIEDFEAIIDEQERRAG